MLYIPQTGQHKRHTQKVTPMLPPMPDHVILELSPEEVRILHAVLNHHLKYFEQEPAYKHISYCLRRIQRAMIKAYTAERIVPEGD